MFLYERFPPALCRNRNMFPKAMDRMQPLTLIEKIIAAHLVEGQNQRGSVGKIHIDQTLLQDATGTMAFLELEAMGVDKVKTEISVQYIDHNTSQFGPENHNDHLYLQTVAAAKGVYFSRAGNGICHQVHLERFGAPGKTLLGSDSHTPTNGGIGMLAIGAGGLDVALAMAGVPFSLTIPHITGVRLSGELAPWVSAKDVILHLLGILTTKGNVDTAVEYFGPGIARLSVPERATITNMGAELGVTASIFPSDEQTRAFLAAQGREHFWQELSADAGAEYDRIIELDLSQIQPMAACPSSPDNITRVSDLAAVEVSQVIVGSCTNGSLKDLMLVASAMDGRTVHPNISMAIAPGSRQVLQMLADNGMLAKLVAAGVRILESACGPCIGQGFSPANDTASVRTFNRNFAGRTGTKGDQAYLVSAETAVATALTGRLTDARSLGIDYPKWQMPTAFTIDDSMIMTPPAVPGPIVRKPTIGEPPVNDAYPARLEAQVLLKLGDKITTDHIMPAGTFLKLRSNIPAYAEVVFNCFNEDGKPSFADRARAVRSSNRFAAIVAGESYGQGSSREHAAICPMYLGVRVVIAKSIERIHAANLINFGILPLLFAEADAYGQFADGDQISIDDIYAQLSNSDRVVMQVRHADGSEFNCTCTHQLSPADRKMILAGGRLNQYRQETAGR